MQDLDDAKVIEVLAKVLTKKGISKVKHNSYISKVLQITTSAGYKKLNGATRVGGSATHKSSPIRWHGYD